MLLLVGLALISYADRLGQLVFIAALLLAYLVLEKLLYSQSLKNILLTEDSLGYLDKGFVLLEVRLLFSCIAVIRYAHEGAGAGSLLFGRDQLSQSEWRELRCYCKLS